MDYFSVIVLIIVTFVFVSDRNIRKLEDLQNNNQEIIYQINNIKNNMGIISIDSKQYNFENVVATVKKIKKEYICIKNSELNLNDNDVNTLIGNYIVSKDKVCGFNVQYVCESEKWTLKKIYIDIINYLNIFNKTDFSTYGVVICKKQDFNSDEEEFKAELVSYLPNESMYIYYTSEQVTKENLKDVYINRIKQANVQLIIKILFLIVSGSIITTNLIYSIINVNNNISGVVISAVVYYCYSYIIRYIYRPIGKNRIIATYIFPIYFISYIIISCYELVIKVIKKVHVT